MNNNAYYTRKIDVLIEFADFGQRTLENKDAADLDQMRRQLVIARERQSGEKIAKEALQAVYNTAQTIKNGLGENISAEKAVELDMSALEKGFQQFSQDQFDNGPFPPPPRGDGTRGL